MLLRGESRAHGAADGDGVAREPVEDESVEREPVEDESVDGDAVEREPGDAVLDAVVAALAVGPVVGVLPSGVKVGLPDPVLGGRSPVGRGETARGEVLRVGLLVRGAAVVRVGGGVVGGDTVRLGVGGTGTEGVEEGVGEREVGGLAEVDELALADGVAAPPMSAGEGKPFTGSPSSAPRMKAVQMRVG